MGGTGNTVAITASVANVAPKPPTQNDCAALDRRNQEARSQLQEHLEGKEEGEGLTLAEEQALGKASGGGMTVSSAKISVGAGPGKIAQGSMTGCSSGKANECLPSSFAGGGSGEVKQGLSSETRNAKGFDPTQSEAGTLCGNSYVHPGGGAGAHGEAKIMNELTEKVGAGNLAGGSVLLNVDWRFNYKGKTHQSGMPCRHCYKMLCHAATECDIEIYLCDANNQPKKLNENDRCYEDDEDGLESLDKSMGEHPIEGLGPV